MLTKFVRWLFGQFHDRASVLLALLAADALLLLFAGVKLVQLDYEVSGSLTAGMWFYGSLILLAGSLGLSLGKRLFRELAGSDDRPNAPFCRRDRDEGTWPRNRSYRGPKTPYGHTKQ